MDDLRTKGESQDDETRSLKRTIRILIVIILILIVLSLSLGYCSYSCLKEPKCPVETPTETSRPVVTLPPQLTKTPTGTGEITSTVTPTDTSTLTPTPSPDLDATATAACEDFMREFPGTPCP
jgi:hypothetical protein